MQFREAQCNLGLLNDWFGLPWLGLTLLSLVWSGILVFSIHRLVQCSVVEPKSNPVEFRAKQFRLGFSIFLAMKCST